jgi:class 3 adenylate cyclase
LSYAPQPIDTTHVTLFAEIQQLTERLAENTHDHWARQRLAEGWTYGPTRDDVKKEHPCLVPYAVLPDAEKQYDHLTVMETLKALMALGYRLEPPGQHAAPASGPTRGGDVLSDPRIDDILHQVQVPDANLLVLLEQYQSATYAPYWQQDIRLYRAFGRALISAGHPTRGFELVRAGLEAFKDNPAWHDDPELRYLRAWALARGGSAAKALEYIEQLLQGSVLDSDIEIEALSLAGSLYKGRYVRTTISTLKGEYAAQSAKWYKSAYKRRADSFPGINAATMSLLAGQGEEARDLALRTLAHVTSERQQPGKEHDHWLLATLGEVYLHLDNHTEAARWYYEAVQQAAGRNGDIASMRRQVQLLAEKMMLSTDILGLFDIGHVVVFSGHMLDHPTRATEGQRPPRFPPDAALEHHIKLAIQHALDALNATVGYSSVACGSDILFAEQMLERHKELHIVLPFNKEDFYATSVDFGLAEMAAWRQRCDRILAQATEVHYTTTEAFLGDAVLFEFVTTFTQGIAIIHAAQLGVQPYALAVRDPAAPPLIGGTTSFVNKWTAGGYPVREVDLVALRMQLSRPLTAWRPATSLQTTVTVGLQQRQVQAMLFADVKNFSRLSDAQLPLFLIKFFDEVADVIAASPHPPTFRNTWGDGLFLVFDRVTDCADFALCLLERMDQVRWEEMNLPHDTALRLGLHAGPVYSHMDKIIERRNFFGSHVNRAARIEPVTTPGCAFTSEQFAAALVVESGHDFVCEYVGVENLAKDYDRCPLYRLGRRESG